MPNKQQRRSLPERAEWEKQKRQLQQQINLIQNQLAAERMKREISQIQQKPKAEKDLDALMEIVRKLKQQNNPEFSVVNLRKLLAEQEKNISNYNKSITTRLLEEKERVLREIQKEGNPERAAQLMNYLRRLNKIKINIDDL